MSQATAAKTIDATNKADSSNSPYKVLRRDGGVVDFEPTSGEQQGASEWDSNEEDEDDDDFK